MYYRRYLLERGIKHIPKNLLQLEEKTVKNGKDITFKYLAFKNDSNAYAVRNAYFKGNKGENNITSINNNRDKTVIVEGTFDMLSIYQKYGDNVNYKILNSTSNMKKLKLDPNQKNILALDNDSAGIEAIEKILNVYKNDKNIKIAMPKNGDWNDDLIKNELNIKVYDRIKFEEQLKKQRQLQYQHYHNR